MLRETRSRLNLWLSNRIRWRRGGYREAAAGALSNLHAGQSARIERLQQRYGVAFERRFNQRNALENYLYLDLLDRFAEQVGADWPRGGHVLDVGSKNFYYAPVLHAAFDASQLTGLELEGFRLYGNLYSRADYADYYSAGLPDTRFEVMDVRDWQQPADIITCFYPFVFEDTHVNWHLPRTRFDPTGFYDALARNLQPRGRLLICNQGVDEAEQSAVLCRERNLQRLTELVVTNPLTPRIDHPILSLWSISR